MEGVFVLKHMRRTKENTITNAEIVDGKLLMRRYDGSNLIFGDESTRAAERLSAIAYGHSWVASTLQASNRWIDRVADSLHLTLDNRAANGSTAQDVSNLLIGAGYGGALAVGFKGLVFIETGAAEIIVAGAITPAMTRSIEENLRAAVLAAIGDVRDEVRGPNGWTFSGGGWAENNAASESSGGSWVYTTTADDWVEKALPAGQYVVAMAALPGAPGLVGATANVLVNGTVVDTVDTDASSYDDTGGNGHISRLVTIPASGATLRIQNTSPSGAYLVVDYVAALSATPPQIVLIREVLGDTTDNDAMNSALDAAIAGLDRNVITVVDPRPDWDATTMIGVDGIHPNDRGTAHVATAVETVLRALPFRAGMNIL